MSSERTWLVQEDGVHSFMDADDHQEVHAASAQQAAEAYAKSCQQGNLWSLRVWPLGTGVNDAKNFTVRLKTKQRVYFDYVVTEGA